MTQKQVITETSLTANHFGWYWRN